MIDATIKSSVKLELPETSNVLYVKYVVSFNRNIWIFPANIPLLREVITYRILVVLANNPPIYPESITSASN